MRIHALSAVATIAIAATFSLFNAGGEPPPAAKAQRGLEHRIFLGQVVRDGTNPIHQAGFVTAASASSQGAVIDVLATVRSRETDTVVIDIETYDSVGRRVDQQWVDNVTLRAGEERVVTVHVPRPGAGTAGPYTVKVGIFEPGPYWGLLLHWNNDATTFSLD